MYCGKCGTKVKGSDQYCPKCGNKLQEDPASPSTPVVIDLWSLLTIPILWLIHKLSDLLKKPNTKTIIKISAACLAVVLLIVLLGNAAGGYNKKLLGTWYLEGNSSPKFTLYDDGSCKIANSYGKGTWSVSNKDQVSISDFYGDETIFTIVSVNNQKLVVGPPSGIQGSNGRTLTYWHTPHK